MLHLSLLDNEKNLRLYEFRALVGIVLAIYVNLATIFPYKWKHKTFKIESSKTLILSL